MAEPCPGLARVLEKLLPGVTGLSVELTERGVEIRASSPDPWVLANVLEQKIDDLFNSRRF